MKVILLLLITVFVLKANEKSLDFNRSALINAPNFFLKGSVRDGIEEILGKPDFIDDKSRCWYRWSDAERKEFSPNYDDLYSRFTYNGNFLIIAELVKIKVEKPKIKLVDPPQKKIK